MTKEEKKRLDAFFAEHLKHEEAFLKENDAELNDNGVYIYTSANKCHSIRLDAYLKLYREYLIENKIVKEL